MSEKTIIVQGMSFDEFREILKSDIRAEIMAVEGNKRTPISKKTACDKLGISFPTLKKAMQKLGMTEIVTTDIDRIRNECPELLTRSRLEKV